MFLLWRRLLMWQSFLAPFQIDNANIENALVRNEWVSPSYCNWFWSRPTEEVSYYRLLSDIICTWKWKFSLSPCPLLLMFKILRNCFIFMYWSDEVTNFHEPYNSYLTGIVSFCMNFPLKIILNCKDSKLDCSQWRWLQLSFLPFKDSWYVN